MIDINLLKNLSEGYGIILTSNQLDKFDKYAELLVNWNQKINLTSLTSPIDITVRHFEDCLAVLKYIDIPEGASLIDVGTGAGFPGLVLKIARPDLNITLLDSLNKRISFLNAVASEIGEEVTTIHARAEEGSRNINLRKMFDFACARAVSNLRVLSEYCLPYVKQGGSFFSMKGPDAFDEIASARPGIGTLGGKINDVFEYQLSDASGRSIILIDKVKPTPDQFPRTSAKINKKPL